MGSIREPVGCPQDTGKYGLGAWCIDEEEQVPLDPRNPQSSAPSHHGYGGSAVLPCGQRRLFGYRRCIKDAEVPSLHRGFSSVQ